MEKHVIQEALKNWSGIYYYPGTISLKLSGVLFLKILS